MLDQLVGPLVDRIVQLGTIWERRRDKRYERRWAPSFADLEKVHGDYLVLIAEVRDLVTLGSDTGEPPKAKLDRAVELIRKRRIAWAPARKRLGALATFSHDQEKTKRLLDSERDFLFAVRNYLYAGSLEKGPGAYMSQSAALAEAMRRIPLDRWVATDVVRHIDEFSERLEGNWGRLSDAFLELELDLIQRAHA